MKTKLVVFDWAGTTVDYGCFAPVNAFALAFQSYGLTPTPDEIRAPMGMLKRDHIRTMLAMERLKNQWIAKIPNRMTMRWSAFTVSSRNPSCGV